MNNVSQVNTGTNPQIVSQKSIMGKDDFFKLLLAQLKNQDPLKPLDGTDFAAQLAQFSSLEQLTNIKSEIKALAGSLAFAGEAFAVGLLGREIIAQRTIADNVEPEDGTISGQVTGIRRDGKDIYLVLGDKEVSISEVVSVK